MKIYLCTIADCDHHSSRRTAPAPCVAHRSRIHRTGSPGTTPIGRYKQPAPPCTAEDCDNPISGKGLCDKHLQRARRTGDPNTLTGLLRGTNNPSYKGDDVGYTAAHDRVRRISGSASQYPCVACGRPARHWAYDHKDPNAKPPSVHNGRNLGPYSTKPEHYQPMCVPCHHILDA